MPEPGTRRAVAVVPDLFFQAKIREAAALTGVPLTIAASEASLREALGAGDVALVIVSLEAREPDPLKAIAVAREREGVRTVGYLNHVLEDLKARALQAGCHEVLAKGAFSKRLADLLREHAGA